MLVDHLTVVGVGLLGGSVGLAAKARAVAGRVVGVGRSEATLSRARAVGAIDAFATDLAAGVAAADVVVVCTPVDRVADDVLAVAKAAKPTAVITDVGSTKAGIVAAVKGKLPAWGARFVGSHPLAGSEKQGADHARPDLFDGRVVVVCPVRNAECGLRNEEPTSGLDSALRTPQAALERVERFWQALGATTVRMTPSDHDAALAVTSHLPHAAAAGLAGVTPVDWLKLTAGGFRDATRIAAGDPELWAAIFEANRDAVIQSLDRFAGRMGEFKRLLAAGDRAAVAEWLAEAKRVRDALGS